MKGLNDYVCMVDASCPQIHTGTTKDHLVNVQLDYFTADINRVLDCNVNTVRWGSMAVFLAFLIPIYCM